MRSVKQCDWDTNIPIVYLSIFWRLLYYFGFSYYCVLVFIVFLLVVVVLSFIVIVLIFVVIVLLSVVTVFSLVVTVLSLVVIVLVCSYDVPILSFPVGVQNLLPASPIWCTQAIPHSTVHCIRTIAMSHSVCEMQWNRVVLDTPGKCKMAYIGYPSFPYPSHWYTWFVKYCKAYCFWKLSKMFDLDLDAKKI